MRRTLEMLVALRCLGRLPRWSAREIATAVLEERRPEDVPDEVLDLLWEEHSTWAEEDSAVARAFDALGTGSMSLGAARDVLVRGVANQIVSGEVDPLQGVSHLLGVVLDVPDPWPAPLTEMYGHYQQHFDELPRDQDAARHHRDAIVSGARALLAGLDSGGATP